LHHAPNILPIPSTRNLDYLEENIRTAELQLIAQDLQALDNNG
jgi:aryl-alcohol dehydrogenase-like predicted oxidoreductase